MKDNIIIIIPEEINGSCKDCIFIDFNDNCHRPHKYYSILCAPNSIIFKRIPYTDILKEL